MRLAALALLLVAAPALATDNTPAPVPATARIVAFVDLDKLKDTDFGKDVQKRLDNNFQFQRIEIALTQSAGFMPSNDIHDATLFAPSIAEKDKYVIALDASFNETKIEAAMSFARDFKTSDVGNHHLIHFTNEDGKHQIMSLLEEQHLIYLSGDETALVEALTTFDQLPADALPMTVPGADDDTFAWVRADVVGMEELKKVPALAEAKTVVLRLSTKGPTLTADLSVQMPSPELAKQATTLTDGLRALGLLLRDETTPKAPLIRKIAAASTVAQDGESVHVKIDLPGVEVLDAIEAR